MHACIFVGCCKQWAKHAVLWRSIDTGLIDCARLPHWSPRLKKKNEDIKTVIIWDL